MSIPSAALLILFSLPASAGTGASYDVRYAQELSDAVLTDAALPAAPEGLEGWAEHARELSLGRPADLPREDYEARILSFCGDLRLDDERSARVLLHLRGRLQGQAWRPETEPVREKAVSVRSRKAVSSGLAAHAAALGLSRFETAPEAGVPIQSGLIPGARLAAAPPPVRGPPAAAAVPDAPLSWAELSKVVKIGHRPYLPGRAGELVDAALRELRNPKGPAAVAETFTRRALEQMQRTPEGREVLRQLVQEYGALGKTVLVRPQAFEGSSLIEHSGVETVTGIRGMADSTNLVYSFNELYMKCKDQASAAEVLAAVMAHEFRHLVSAAQVRRLSPAEEGAFRLALINEQRARQTGYLVGGRLAGNKPNEVVPEVLSIAQDPDGFWEGLKGSGSYAVFLDMKEMADPVPAYQSRLARVAEERKHLAQLLSVGLPRMRMALDIMTKKEGLGPEADELRGQLLAMAVSLPVEDQRLEGLGKAIESILGQMQDPRRVAELEQFKAAGSSKAFRQLQADLERDEKALAELVKGKPMPKPQPAASRLDWPQFWGAVKKSMKEHPQHWTEFFKKYGRLEAK